MERYRSNIEAAANLSEGERYLELIGLLYMADKLIITADGRRTEVRNFLDICGEHARPVFAAFEKMSKDNPKYEPTKKALQELVLGYVKK